MITTLSDSLTVGCAIATAAKAAVRSSALGVQASARGATEGERGPRLQQLRQGSEVVSALYTERGIVAPNRIGHCKLL